MEPVIEAAADAEMLARKVAAWLVERIAFARSPFALSLSGGSTPAAAAGQEG